MKKIIFISVLFALMGYCNLYGQSFKYEYSETLVSVTPAFEELALKGKKSGNLTFDKDYFDKTIGPIAVNTLSGKTLALLKENPRYLWIHACISTSGDIFYLEFVINKKCMETISEKELLDLYHAYRKIKLDISRSSYDLYGPFDYGSYMWPAILKNH